MNNKVNKSIETGNTIAYYKCQVVGSVTDKRLLVNYISIFYQCIVYSLALSAQAGSWKLFWYSMGKQLLSL